MLARVDGSEGNLTATLNKRDHCPGESQRFTQRMTENELNAQFPEWRKKLNRGESYCRRFEQSP